MNVKILGPGCANCKTLERNTRDALEQADYNATVEKVEDMADIMKYGVMSTPSLVVDDEVVVTGRVPSAKEIADLLAR
jgi:small redox-active disulfide protein 2